MMTVPDIKKTYNDVSNFPVVGIGASAGGLEILKKIVN